MAQGKKSVLIYTDWISTFEELEDCEAGKLIKHFFRYVNYLNPEPPDRLTKLVFEPIKQALKRDLKKYESIVDNRRLAGLASAEKRKQIQQVSTLVNTDEQDSTNSTHIDNDIDSVIVSDIEKEKKEKEIFISRDHLSITWGEMNKLIDSYGEEVANDTVNNILNYRKNLKYKTIYLTAIKWIKRDIADKAKLIDQKQRPKLAI